MSRRQYNKRFRLAVRMEKKLQRLAREKFKRAIFSNLKALFPDNKFVEGN